MKKIRVLLLCLFVLNIEHVISQEQNSPLEKKISLQATNEPISSILQKIEKSANVSFSYNSEIIDVAKHLTFSFNKKSVGEIIQYLFDSKITCKAKGNHLILIPTNKTQPNNPAKNSSNNKIGDEKKVINKPLDTLADENKKTISIDTAKHAPLSNGNTFAKQIDSVSIIKKEIRKDTVISPKSANGNNPDKTTILSNHNTIAKTPEKNSNVQPDKKKSPDQQSKFGIGIIAGMNLANVTGESNSSFVIDGTGGAYVKRMLNLKFAFQAELLFSAKGYNYSSTEISSPNIISSIGTQQFYYLEIPLLLKFNINSHFGIMCGPYVSFLTQASFNTETSVNGIVNYRNNGNNTNEYKSIDIGGNVGLSYFFLKRITLGISYSKGFRNLSKDSGSDAITNSVFSTSIGFRIK